MNFTAKGRQYKLQPDGHIEQVDAKPYLYDAKYSSTYDTPEYNQKAEILQALRLGFVIGNHGRIPENLTDMGYGNGAFLKTARQLVPNCFGYDITDVPLPDGVKRSQFNDGTGPNFFYKRGEGHVVTFWDCFEHIPIDTLKMYISQMHECEIEIAISLPNCDVQEFGLNWFEEAYPHLKPDEHLRHFSAKSLKDFMSGWNYKTYSISYHEDMIRKRYYKNILSMYFKPY